MPTRTAALLALPAAAVALWAAAPARAQTPPAPSIRLVVERAGAPGPLGVLVGARFRVRGIVTPYVPGQSVTVRFQRGASRLRVVTTPVYRPAGATAGQFLVGYTTRAPGRILVRASHRATPEMGTAVAAPRTVAVVAPRARAGDRGPAVRLLQRGLRGLGYVVGARGLFDARTARAVLAFRKVAGLARTEEASPEVFRRLRRGGGRFRVRHPDHGHHAEADLSHQVLALIDGGRVERIYPISSGKPSTPTVLGSFHVYLKSPGTNAKGMVFSNYFVRGYAIHGYFEVPVYAASHGCLRVPVPDAVPIYRWLRLGDAVDVYYRTPGHRHPRPSAGAGP